MDLNDPLGRVAEFPTKNNSAEDGIDEKMVIYGGITAVPSNRKLSEFRFEPFRGRENNS
jgi:hypothetical protein